MITHIGRPEGKVVEELRVAPVEKKLRELTQAPFVMEENLRFDPGDEANDPEFAKKLATLGDIFVNDAFAVCHRAEASTVGVAQLLPSYAGFLIQKEIEKLSGALTPPSGAIAIIGGAKVETKAPLIEKFASIYSKVLVGGAIANEYKPTAANVLMPTDGAPQLVGMFDIGPQTKAAWVSEIANASFVAWNGPVGMYEKEPFNEGTNALAGALVASKASAVIGGGDTAAALEKFTFDPARIFISTGGGAMLELLIHGTLPGIEALKK